MDQSNPDLYQLVDSAYSIGVSDAALIRSSLIKVRDELALKCTQPRCENYGLSYSCPPFVEGPDKFKQLIHDLPDALVVRLIIPASMLLSWERLELGRVLHELVARLEKEAIQLGYINSTSFAGGSCKELFCYEHLSCQRIAQGGPCRHPDLARPSLSGYGVDVFELIKSCSWDSHLKTENNSKGRDLSWVAGLILIG